ncbi:hypothetical protein AMET1_0984 [Methanonatronarchaeum thermophilum]|uniref:Uncharacterized protein n=1 Tax=Methanonatronarchaeum thermophilum TaxID=1927129 RepID=A0A1Y3GD11_9EURY|nr:hypothetical protein AMET1_0984 [Methanonatronarchaeum thermophilum]
MDDETKNNIAIGWVIIAAIFVFGFLALLWLEMP